MEERKDKQEMKKNNKTKLRKEVKTKQHKTERKGGSEKKQK